MLNSKVKKMTRKREKIFKVISLPYGNVVAMESPVTGATWVTLLNDNGKKEERTLA